MACAQQFRPDQRLLCQMDNKAMASFCQSTGDSVFDVVQQLNFKLPSKKRSRVRKQLSVPLSDEVKKRMETNVRFIYADDHSQKHGSDRWRRSSKTSTMPTSREAWVKQKTLETKQKAFCLSLSSSSNSSLLSRCTSSSSTSSEPSDNGVAKCTEHPEQPALVPLENGPTSDQSNKIALDKCQPSQTSVVAKPRRQHHGNGRYYDPWVDRRRVIAYVWVYADEKEKLDGDRDFKNTSETTKDRSDVCHYPRNSRKMVFYGASVFNPRSVLMDALNNADSDEDRMNLLLNYYNLVEPEPYNRKGERQTALNRLQKCPVMFETTVDGEKAIQCEIFKHLFSNGTQTLRK